MIEDLTIAKIKDMLWEEVIIPAFGNAPPGDHSWEASNLARNFTIRHRLCMEDVQVAWESLLAEYRKLPSGCILQLCPTMAAANVPMGDEYEGMIATGALQCVNPRRS